jgi:poly(3-hydroxybutyrate) depolymerase
MTTSSPRSNVRLKSRPGDPRRFGEPGLHPLTNDNERGGLLYVPAGFDQRGAALAVSFHGAAGNARDGIDILRTYADAGGFLLLAPASAGPTWDLLLRGNGPEVAALDGALGDTFAAYRVDASRLAITGFSDGASYALSLGLANGDLFSHVIAFSPGFVTATRLEGRPLIFVSHGQGDVVLPIASSSRRIVPRLRESGYTITYREFDGGHVIPAEIREEATSWFLGRPEA